MGLAISVPVRVRLADRGDAEAVEGLQDRVPVPVQVRLRVHEETVAVKRLLVVLGDGLNVLLALLVQLGVGVSCRLVVPVGVGDGALTESVWLWLWLPLAVGALVSDSVRVGVSDGLQVSLGESERGVWVAVSVPASVADHVRVGVGVKLGDGVWVVAVTVGVIIECDWEWLQLQEEGVLVGAEGVAVGVGVRRSVMDKERVPVEVQLGEQVRV